jgi:hypothetical protein
MSKFPRSRLGLRSAATTLLKGRSHEKPDAREATRRVARGAGLNTCLCLGGYEADPRQADVPKIAGVQDSPSQQIAAAQSAITNKGSFAPRCGVEQITAVRPYSVRRRHHDYRRCSRLCHQSAALRLPHREALK